MKGLVITGLVRKASRVQIRDTVNTVLVVCRIPHQSVLVSYVEISDGE